MRAKRRSMAVVALATFSASPLILRSEPRFKTVTENSLSISLIFSSKLPNKLTAFSIRSILRTCSNTEKPP